MKGRLLVSLCFVFMLTCLLSVPAFASPLDDGDDEGKVIYVSALGSDETGTGEENSPYKTLNKAVENGGDGDTICIASDLTVNETVIINNNLTICGLLNSENERPIIKTASVSEELSGKYYSIFDIRGKTVTIKDIAFSGEETDTSGSYSAVKKAFYGGAIIVGGGSSTTTYGDNTKLTVDNCTFTSFEAHQGGAICSIINDKVEINIKNSTFTNNMADVGGGAICGERCKNFTLKIENSKFLNNSAGDSTSAGNAIYGGAVYVNHSSGQQDLSFIGSEFKDNTSSSQGGALAFILLSEAAGKVTMADTTFTNNKTINSFSGNGGAVYAERIDVMSVTNCNFIKNYAAKHGGAMHIASDVDGTSEVTFNKNVFQENTAATQGGAVNLSNGGVNTYMDRVLFQENTTDINTGDAIAYFSSSQAVTHSYLNSTDGAVFYKNGIEEEDGVNDNALYVQLGSSDDKVSITDYMLDGTRLNWKKVEEVDDEALLVPADSAYHELASGTTALYLDEDTDKPLSLAQDKYSNIFIGNHARYGGAISNYGSLIIGTPGKNITVTKDWDGEAAESVTVNLVREIDKSTLENVEIKAADQWQHIFYDFPANVNYTITENPIKDYVSSVTKNQGEEESWTVKNTKILYYTLHYESNGGTEYSDEEFAIGTVVPLDKVPVREGYTFTGWYADAELAKPIKEIEMTSEKTVYAGWEATDVPGWLNGKDHFAYIIGYEDGTVRPLNNISRGEIATIIFRLLNEDVRDEYLTEENTFDDVDKGIWCNTAISTLANMGILYGRSSEYFDFNTPITRGELAAICARFDDSDIEISSDFSDIDGHYSEREIERAASLGWIIGYADGTFRPDNLITRAETMTMINRVLKRMPEDESDLLEGMNVWPDNQRGTWYYLAVQEATNSHDYELNDGVHERWIKLNDDPDWKQYEN